MEASEPSSGPTTVVNGASSPTESGQGSEKRKRQPRNSACRPCATLKMRCVPGPMPGKCERCHRMQRDCEAAVAKPRKRRLTNYDREIMLKSSESGPDALVSNGLNRDLSTAAYDDRDRQPSALRRSDVGPSRPGHDESPSCVALIASSINIVKPVSDLLDGLDYAFIQNSLAVLRHRLDQFPFIMLPTEADAAQLAANRPLTTLAICTVAASANSGMQNRLAQAFRMALALNVLVDGRRSLDIFAASIIFLAWHHNYMEKPQIYQMLCLMAGMAADFGLYQEPYKLETTSLHSALERDRAFVAGYILCCRLSILGFHKPNPMRWTDNLRLCAENVAKAGMRAIDQRIVAWLELTKVVEDIDEMLHFLGLANNSASARGPPLELPAKAASHRLEAIKRQYPELDGSLSYNAVKIHIHHRILRLSTHESAEDPLLVQCACIIKEYLDDILSMPPAILHQCSILEWTSLLESLVLMTRISRPSPTNAGWEAGALSAMLQPDIMLDSIVRHMAAAPTNDLLVPRHEGQLRWFQGVCESIKQKYLRYNGATAANGVREGESHYDVVHSLGQHQKQRTDPAEIQSRFRPVNQEYLVEASRAAVMHPHAQRTSGTLFDRRETWDNGVLDEAFWEDVMKP